MWARGARLRLSKEVAKAGVMACLCHILSGQPAPLEQGLDPRQSAPERHIKISGIGAAAGAEDVGLQRFGFCGVERPACFLKGGKGVGVHHLGPHVAVIARRISVACKDMGEMWRRVAHPDGVGHAHFGKDFGLPRHGIGGGVPLVEGQIDHGRSHIFHRREPHVIGRRGEHVVEQCGGHCLARFGVGRVFAQHLRHVEPVFIKLAGQFHKVARHGGARDAFIGHVRQHLVQGVAKFVKERARVIIAEQSRIALGKVADVDDDRRLRFGEFGLRPHGRAPRP
mmetsp:Transcript_22989/g.38801  ORF Transcript_22989/g.38801 Transcript_22989/m.38801 type:complete len:282 (+) Transcript_22989:1502-2347(+)